MRQQGSILLISCYELGHQPIGIASPMGFLERAGFSPTGLDIAREELDARRVAPARFVGISVPMHTALRLGVELARRVRTINPGCHICFYGLYASLNSEYLLQSCADSIVGGEYEEALVKLVEALEEGRPVHSINEVGCRDKSSEPVLRRLAFPVPSREELPPLKEYAQLERNGHQHLAGYVEASRGCLHLCLHCPIPSVYGGRFFVVEKAIVLEDIRRLVRAGAEHITFGDPDFLNGPGHSLRIVRAMHDEFSGLTFDFTAKVEHLLKHRTILPELARLGCLFVVSAVESLSDTVLTALKKGHTRADVTDALGLLRSCGIALRPSLVAFTPWTTLDDYLDVLEFVEMEKLIDHIDPVQYSIRLLIPPGSGLLSERSIRPHLVGLDQPSFTYRWTHPDPRMDELQAEVAAEVERASSADEDAAVTFGRVKRLAFGVHKHRRAVGEIGLTDPNRKRPPRLTESWFC
jgi:radical SAM superfamily enzyme YgiQ (UPF0313 family)